MNDLRARREALGMSAARLSRAIWAANGYIAAVERGKTKPSEKMRGRIETVLSGGRVVERETKYPIKDKNLAKDLARIWRRDYAPLRRG